ncbi:hypothetical protein [Ewingella americana]|nr:hypothetical protein [Ewingella americana]
MTDLMDEVGTLAAMFSVEDLEWGKYRLSHQINDSKQEGDHE